MLVRQMFDLSLWENVEAFFKNMASAEISFIPTAAYVSIRIGSPGLCAAYIICWL